MYYLKSRNELGEIENGIGDGEVYEYTTIEEFLDDNSRMMIDINDGTHLLFDEYDCEVPATELAAAALGSIKSEKKAKSSAENGKKGGRPRKFDVELWKTSGMNSPKKVNEYYGSFVEIHNWVSKFSDVIVDNDYEAYMDAGDIDALNEVIYPDYRIDIV